MIVRPRFDGPVSRILLIALLVLLLQVPGCMIGELTRERQKSRDDARAEVGQTWGVAQRVAGPVLVIPYRIRGVDEKNKPVDVETGAIVVMPERLGIDGSASAETLRRGLFDVPVYRGQLKLSGRFRAPRAEIGALVPREALQWDQAHLVLRVTDVHAIDRVSALKWGAAVFDFQGGAGALGAGGLQVPLPGLAPDLPMEFSTELTLRGSDALHFAAPARSTAVALRSDWPHPKFGGAWLPDARELRADGFTANWQVTSLAAGLPAAWKVGSASHGAFDASAFGVELISPVDTYRMTERTLKYSLLFLGLTFAVVWLIEQKSGRAAHPIQYLLVGASLCVFYLLELSLAEHFGFATAYAVAATAVTLQVSLYARAALGGLKPALALMGVVAALYGLLYAMLGAEDYALLVGSITLFAMLSAVMFLTRRVKWGV
ncbi:MAG TPA: cell envelope integrity protein CreD [Verrucomicrobiae bacterium]|nr:cell envelope integrity protein CreD [Verrucomicrobiae bacterium]